MVRALATLVLATSVAAAQPAGDTVGGFTLPEDRDSKQRLAAVTDYLAKKEVPWEVVCATAQQLLDGKSDSFTPLADGTRVSVKGRVSDLLGALPKDGQQFYELTYGPPATARLTEATAKGYDRAKLADIAQRYFHTKAGTQAAVLLASLQLDAGDTAEAAYGFRRLLARPDANEWAGPWLLARAATAYKRTGDPKLALDADKLFDRLDRAAPRDGLAVGRKTFTPDDLRKQASEVATRVRVGEAVAGRYGNPSHTGRGPAGSPFLDPAFAPVPLLYRPDVSRDGAAWVTDKLDEVYKKLDPGKGQVVLPGFFPVTVPGLVVYRGYDAVYAVATRDGYVYQGKEHNAGQVVWLSDMYFSAQSLVGGRSRVENAARIAEDAWRGFWQQTGRVLVDNTQTGALSHDGKRVYAVDDWAVPPGPPTVNVIGGFNPVQGSGPVRGVADTSLLCAIGLDTGGLVWMLGGPADEPAADDKPVDAQRALANSLFLGPPLPADGKLYVLFEKDGQVRLACLDPDRVALGGGANPSPQPALLWVQDLGAPATKLPNDPQRRTHACFPAFADGVLVCPTHAGAAVAVDVNARALLWAKGYAAAPDPARQVGEGGNLGIPGGGIGGRRFPGGAPRLNVEPGALAASSADRWRAAAPIISDGKVVLAAPDADQLLCLDLRTGEQLWSDPRRKDDLYVGGVIDGVVLVVGKAGVRAVKLLDPVAGKPVEAWPDVPTGSPSGHGTVGADGVFYLPLADGGSGPADAAEPQVWAITVATGAVKAKTSFRRPDATADPRRAIGNLLFHDGLLVSQTVDAVTAFPLLDIKQQEMTRRLKADAADPRGLLLRGEMNLDRGDLKSAAADFKAATDRDPPADLRPVLRQKLYMAYTELLRADFPANASLLGEYEKLCEVVAEGGATADRQKAADESARRRGLYLSLVARGREKQGRLADAVGAYLEFAGLGDGKLTAMAGEPVGKVRPDVWAEGRLGDLLAAASPEARKQLSATAAAEWQAVKQSGDLGRLRRFVAGYAPHESAGKAAAVELAGRLLAANTPADRREGLALLLRLTADPDPIARAAATDRLAAALTASGQVEHAVGLYARLGGEFKDVPVADGQTGGARLAGLLADRRLLAHLEPGRPPLTGRYSVTTQETVPSIGGMPAVGVRVDGPLLPSLSGIRLTFQQGGNNDNRWVLTATDGLTGGELFKQTDLPPPAGGLGQFVGGVEPVALGCGHLVLLVLGTNAHCFDLLEKKEAWRYPLLGRAQPAANMTVRPTPDGDSEYSFDDGFLLRLGRAAVLRPAYAALVTREGLVCLDPATQQTRWERADVSPRVQVWGDDRHLFLVETDAQGVPSSRVLRAADGATVTKIPDFAKLYMSAGRRTLIGRRLLLDSGSGTSPRTLRLYDPLAGRDEWSREVPAGAVLTDGPDRGLVGWVSPVGRLTVLDATTGKQLADAKLTEADGANPVARLSRACLLADADRFYLFLTAGPGEGQRPGFHLTGGPTVAQVAVNGPAFCVSRQTGEVVWHTDRLFVGRTLVTERFDELPALVTCTDAPMQRPGEATPAALVRVEVVDKATGRVRHHSGHPNVGPFFAAAADPKTHAVEVVRPDVRVRLAPDAGR